MSQLGSALDRIESALARPAVAAAVAFAVAFLSAAEARVGREHFPVSHEDFSHLLAADTFARGRLANPAPEHWVHFESPLLLAQPSYVSALPPAQGALLALGQRLGSPLVGSALGLGLACAALCWMLAGWLRGLWPLLGALALALHPRIVGVWGAGFSTGLPALIGAALLVGALPRLLRDRVSGGIALGAGAAWLALSQPFHGLVAALPAAVWLCFRLLRRGPGQRLPARALAVTLVALAGAAAFHAWYDWRTTGSALETPWGLYRETYAPVPDLLILERGEPTGVRNASFEWLHGENSQAALTHASRRSWDGFWQGVLEKLGLCYRFFLLPGLAAIFLALPFALREPGVRFALLSCALYGLALPLDTSDRAFHVASYLPMGALLFTSSIKRWSDLRLGRFPLGALAAMALLLCGWYQQIAATNEALEERLLRDLQSRAKITTLLERRADQSLVLVGYGRGQSASTEWVYNEADLDATRVLFARSISPEADQALVLAYPERVVWQLSSNGRRLGVAGHPDAASWRGAPRAPERLEDLSPEQRRALEEKAADLRARYPWLQF
jgi:hypothetical protein